MKPVLKQRMVEYWSCGIEGHHHKNKVIAENCIKKQSNKKPLDLDAHRKTNSLVLSLWLDGKRQCDIAREIGKSQTRARQIIMRFERMARQFHLTKLIHRKPSNYSHTYVLSESQANKLLDMAQEKY